MSISSWLRPRGRTTPEVPVSATSLALNHRAQTETPHLSSGRSASLSSDHAIKHITEDRLGFGDTLLPKLIRVTLDWPSERGIVIGLYGPWGSGKTSLLNLFVERVKHGAVGRIQRRSALIVRFTPTFYDDYAVLVRTFFSTIARELGEGSPETEQIARHMQVMGAFLAAATSGLGVIAPGVKPLLESISTLFTKSGEATTMLDDGERTLQEARDAAERGLARMGYDGQRVVVLLDDLERLDRTELLNLLRVVRFVADMPNMTVVLAMDDVRARSLIGQGQERESEYGKEYLEKFVQVSIRVPPPEPVRFALLIAEELRIVFQDYGVELPKELSPAEAGSWFSQSGPKLSLLLRMVKSPRDLGRWSNTLRMLLLADETIDVHPTDASLIAAIEVFHPDFYERIRGNRSLLTGERNLMEEFFLRGNERAERNAQRLRDLVGDEGSPHASLYKSVIEALFGDLKEFDRTDDHLSLSILHSIPSAERQVRSPAFFDRYFGYSTEVGALSQRSVLQLISEIEKAGEVEGSEDTIATLLASVFTALAPEYRERLISDLRVRFANVNAATLVRAGHAALRLPATLEPEVAFRLLTAALARLCGPNDHVSYGTEEAQARSADLVEKAIDLLPSHFDRLLLLTPRAGLSRCLSEVDRHRLALTWLERLDEDLRSGVDLNSEYGSQTASHILGYALELLFELRYKKMVFTGAHLTSQLRDYIRESVERFVPVVEYAVGPWGLGLITTPTAPQVLKLIDNVLAEPGFAKQMLCITRGKADIPDQRGVLQMLNAALELHSSEQSDSRE